VSEHDQELLWRYFDGDLPSEQAAAFAQRLGEDAELSAEFACLEQTRALLRADTENAVAAADFSGFLDGVLARVGDEALGAPAAREPAPVPATSEGLGARFAAWWRAHWTPVVASAVAAAVVAFLVVRGSAEDYQLTPGPVQVDAVHNAGNQTVLISQPVGEPTVIWLLDDEEEPADSSMKGEDPI